MRQRQSRTQKQAAKPTQKQRLAQVASATDGLRDGADALDAGGRDAPTPGRITDPAQFDRDQEPADETDLRRERPAPPRLRDILGAKRPRVCLRVKHLNGRVVVEFAFHPKPGAKAATTLLSLRDQVEVILRDGLRDHPEWTAPLLHGKDTTAEERRLLLDQLAVKPGKTIAVPGGSGFKPNNLQLGGYEHKFATFPDGAAFSLRLLFRDDRGRRVSEQHPFAGWSPDEMREVLCEALRAERESRVAANDEQFGKALHTASKRLNRPIRESLTDKQVARLRTKFGGDTFPNKRDRQKSYDAEAGE